MGAIGKIIADVVAAILGAVFSALRGKRQDIDRIDTHERAATAEAAQETSDAIAAIADERSALHPPPDDPDALAAILRRRKSAAAGGGGANGPGAGHAGSA